MSKRKVDSEIAEDIPRKKAKVASGKGSEVGPKHGVTSMSGASNTGEPDVTDATRQDEQDKGKGADAVSDGEEDLYMENGSEGGEEDDGNKGVAAKSSNAPAMKVRKLAPPRPYPTVPTSVSATGPRSAHSEGKNYICITRKTKLAAYLRRCKDAVMKDGFKTLHLNAMGAAIPHLLQLSVSLPSVLPHPPEDIHTEVCTGTVEVQDELIPDDEDEDISYRTRGKSTLSVVIKIGDGVDEVLKQPKNKSKGRNANRSAPGPRSNPAQPKGGQKARAQGGLQRVVIRAEDMNDG